MPFKSEAQRRYLWANEPEIARDWTDTYGSKIHAANGGIMRLGLKKGSGGPAGGATIGSGSAQSGSPASSGGHGGPGPHAGGGGGGGGGGWDPGVAAREQAARERSRIQTETQAGLDTIGAPPGMNTAPNIPVHQPQNFIQQGIGQLTDLYNKYGMIPNILKLGQNLFGPKEPSWNNFTKGNPHLEKKVYDWGPTGGGDGQGQGQQNYPPWWDNTYDQNLFDEDGFASNILEDEELDIDTSTGDMDEWIQRFKVKDPYRQDRGALDEQIKEYVSKLYTTP